MGIYRTNENCSLARQNISLRRTGIISFIVWEARESCWLGNGATKEYRRPLDDHSHIFMQILVCDLVLALALQH